MEVEEKWKRNVLFHPNKLQYMYVSFTYDKHTQLIEDWDLPSLHGWQTMDSDKKWHQSMNLKAFLDVFLAC